MDISLQTGINLLDMRIMLDELKQREANMAHRFDLLVNQYRKLDEAGIAIYDNRLKKSNRKAHLVIRIAEAEHLFNGLQSARFFIEHVLTNDDPEVIENITRAHIRAQYS